ncbi:MAG: glycosyltransferase [Nitrospirae bacterium]|nr:glycosyltransferase [Nitrospirota bacterium]
MNIKQKIFGLLARTIGAETKKPPPPPPPITANCDKAVLTLDAIDIMGWAVSQDGIKAVEVYIDEALIAPAVYGNVRIDIQAAFPEISNALNAGFCLFKALEPLLTAGPHRLEVKITSNDGHIDIKQFQIETTETYEVFSQVHPQGIIDCDRVLLGLNSIDITGYAICQYPQPGHRLDVYLDDIFIKSAATALLRPDIETMYPCYKDSINSGFCLYCEFETPIEEGPHTLTLRAEAENGIQASRSFTVDAVRDVSPFIAINCDEIHFGLNAVEINGFSVSSEKITNIEVYIDDVLLGNAPYGLVREDAAKAYPCYRDSDNSGFCFYKRFDMPLSPGTHTLAVKALTEGGHSNLWSEQMEIDLSYEELTHEHPNIFIYCDTPVVTFDVIDIVGWAVAPEEIKEIDVFIDDVFTGNAHCGVPTEALSAIYPCYKDAANAGFCLYKTLESPLSEGQHTLKIKVRTNNAQDRELESVCEAIESYRSYTASNPKFIAAFERCLVTYELIQVLGWIVTPAGLKTTEVFIDGDFIGYAVGVNKRYDIEARYPCYKKQEMLLLCLDKILETRLSDGRHLLTIKATAKDGQSMSWDFEQESIEPYADYLMRTAPEALIQLDKAAMSLDFVEVRGWALSPDGIDKVEVYLDNKFTATAYYGFERGDMKETFPLHKTYKDGAKCGFCLYKKLDEELSTGYHTLKIMAVSRTGLSKAVYEYNFINRPYRQMSYGEPKIILSCDKLQLTLDVVEVEGWAASPDGISSVEIYVDGVYIDKAFHGISTREIGMLLPCYKNSSNSAFVLYNAYENSFTAGHHTVMLKIISETGLIREWSTRYYVSDSYEKYLDKLKPPTMSKVKRIIEEFLYRPKISIAMPVYNISPRWLDKCIQSVIDQYYENWELCIYDDASSNPETLQCLNKWKDSDPRIKIAFGTVNMHISGATNEALKLAEGEFIALLDNDDELTHDALYENVKLLNENSELDFIYSDEDKLEEDGTRSDPFFKPDWSPELFCSMMYTCHLGVYRKSIIDKINGFRRGYEGSQDYDMVLRFIGHTAPERIAHIPKALYHWRKIYGSASGNAQHKTYAFDSAMKALKDYMERNSIEGELINVHDTGIYRIKRRLMETPLVSIIIPTRDKVQYLEKCVNSLIDTTDYPNVEIIILDTGSVEPATNEFYEEIRHRETIRIIDYPNPEFNYAEANNWAAERASGPYVLFLNNDTEAIEPEWLSAMMEYGQLPDVGAVGAKLLYPGNGIQHMGVVVGLKRAASHIGRLYPDEKPMGFPFLHAKDVVRNVTAVTGACLLMRRALFDEINGFDVKFRIAFNDIDLCLRLRKKGCKVIYTPYAKLYHHESVSVGKPYEDTDRCAGLFETEVELFRERWDIENYIDPFFNKNLDESLRFKH